MILHRLLDRLFGAAEEINGQNRCATYLYRWTLISTRAWKVYLHRFVGDDWSYDLHDHPKRFVTIGLWGSYLEQTPAGFRRWRAPWLRTFPPTHRHRLTTPWGDCWTLLWVGRRVRNWGFYHQGRMIPWQDYVAAGSAEADAAKACD